MAPTYDFHMHTKYLRCANETMEVNAIDRECRRLGMEAIGITDHLNQRGQLELHRSILADIRRLDTDLPVYFGVELNFTGEGQGFVFDEEIKASYGFQYAIGGIHQTYVEQFDLTKVIEIQHRHHLLTCENPLVDALVHPYWFNGSEFKAKGFPEFGSVALVPEALTRELAAAAVETGTAIEINAGANLYGRSEDYRKAYADYVAILAEAGVKFLLASDAHAIDHLARVRMAWGLADRLHLTDDQIWRPGCEPVAGGSTS